MSWWPYFSIHWKFFAWNCSNSSLWSLKWQDKVRRMYTQSFWWISSNSPLALKASRRGLIRLSRSSLYWYLYFSFSCHTVKPSELTRWPRSFILFLESSHLHIFNSQCPLTKAKTVLKICWALIHGILVYSYVVQMCLRNAHVLSTPNPSLLET